jgi:hypothetical protein
LTAGLNIRVHSKAGESDATAEYRHLQSHSQVFSDCARPGISNLQDSERLVSASARQQAGMYPDLDVSPITSGPSFATRLTRP